MKDLSFLNSLKNKIAQCGQSVYDDWYQDESGYDEMVGNGGICHLIADKIVDLLYESNIDCTTVSSDHEVHVYVVAKIKEGVFSVDIPYSFYETGGGYTWKKIPNRFFDDSVVYIDQISCDPNDFEKEYCEDY